MAEKALSFDGIDNYAADDDATRWLDVANGTLECWCKVDVTDSLPIQAGLLITKRKTESAGESPLIRINADGSITLMYCYDDVWKYISTEVLSWAADTWYYIVGSWGADGIQVWRNGVREAYNAGETSPAVEYTNRVGVIRLGGGPSDTQPFKGIIDEARISNKQRTSAEIAYAWNGGSGRAFELDGNTLALYHLNEGSNGTAYDETDNNHDLAIDGAGWVDGFIFSVEKTSSDSGDGTEAGASLNSAYSLLETGTGSESLGSRLLGVAEEGGGTETLLARLLASTETASGLDFGGLFFVSSDVGSGLDAILALEAILTGADSGSGIDTTYLIKILLSTDSGLGAEAVAALLATIVAGELMVGSDCLVVKIESAPKGGGMRLPPGGKTSIPSRRVNL